jgi:mannan endo-1,6-alpha-mannosidase
MAAMSAAETNFDTPAADEPSWLSLAQAVFNEQIGRWDTSTCGGGLRWQVFQANPGYNLKNSISNGGLFNVAARLARFTHDDLYAQWAYKIWDWMVAIGLIDENYNVYDNSEADRLNCTQLDRNQWSYNAGTMLMGASTLYNYVSFIFIAGAEHTDTRQTDADPTWENRTKGLMKAIAFDYFPAQDGGVMKDICEQYNACNVDQKSFKAYLSRWMAASTQMAPFLYNQTLGLLQVSAKAAAAQCNGDGPVAPAGQTCGLKWYLNGTWDGTDGVGQQMAAMEVILGTLIHITQAPLTNTTGGTSVSNPTAGYNSSNVPPPTPAERAGAWVLTFVLVILALWTGWFMWSMAWEPRERKVASPAASWKGKERENYPEMRSSTTSIVVLPRVNEEKIGTKRLSKVKFSNRMEGV